MHHSRLLRLAMTAERTQVAAFKRVKANIILQELLMHITPQKFVFHLDVTALCSLEMCLKNRNKSDSNLI